MGDQPVPAVIGDKRKASRLEFKGRVYVPQKKSGYSVGPGTWFKDETGLSVNRRNDFPESILVGASDAQICFPPWEVWVLRTRFNVISDETVPVVAIELTQEEIQFLLGRCGDTIETAFRIPEKLDDMKAKLYAAFLRINGR